MTETDNGQSARKLSARAVHEDAERVLDRVTDSFFALNHDWEFTYLNSSAVEHLERPASELLGKNVWEEFPPEASSTFKSRYEKALETDSPVRFEAYYPPLERTFDVRAYPSESGLSVYFRDISVEKRYENRLATVRETAQRLLCAETDEDVAEIAVESAAAVTEFPEVALYYWDEETGVLEPAAATDAIAERYDRDLPTLSGGESILWDAFVEGESRFYDESRPPSEKMYDPDSPLRRRIMVPVGDRGVVFAGAEEGGEKIRLAVEFLELLAKDAAVALEAGRRERALAENDERIRCAEGRLSELKRINEIIREIDRALIRATGRSEVETAVCEKLAAVDSYRLTWFGELDPQTDEIAVRASVGGGRAYLDRLLDEGTDGRCSIPAAEALRTDEAVFTDNILAESSAASWRKEALDGGYRSMASLPVRFHEVTYGVLEIYADSPNAFSEEERAVLRDLGEVIGNALNAIERKEALLADVRVELKLRFPESDCVVSRTAADVGCEISVESLLPRSDDTWLVYFTTDGADPEAVMETARGYSTVDSIERIRSAGEGELFGLILAELTGLDFLAEKGATLLGIAATPVETEITVEIPRSVSVRSFVQTCRAQFPSAELVSRQQVTERDSEATNERLLADLTDQQRKALEVALEGGFFAWPRDKTGEEIAESLGVSPPTFHRHVRVGLEKIVSRTLG